MYENSTRGLLVAQPWQNNSMNGLDSILARETEAGQLRLKLKKGRRDTLNT